MIALEKRPDRTAVGDVMTPRPVVVTLDDSAIEALELMLQHEIRYLPVRDGAILRTESNRIGSDRARSLFS